MPHTPHPTPYTLHATPDAPLVAIGLMSGTSADGVDAALVRLHPDASHVRAELLAHETFPYPEAIRETIFSCFENQAGVRTLCLLHAALGDMYADVAEQVWTRAALPSLAFVACHGQTLWHEPDPQMVAPSSRKQPPLQRLNARGTFQLGEAARIAVRLGVPVVSDFRQQDIALGGEGAPLVPYVDYLLFADPQVNRAIQNLGGIGNVTYLPAGCAPDRILAFDTGPGNCWIDAAVEMSTQGSRKYDVDGKLARRGVVEERWLHLLLEDDYLQRPPPKSCGREWYNWDRLSALWDSGLRGANLVATVTQFTAETIALGYRRWLGPVDEVILGGGGTRNPELVRRVRAALAPARVALHEDHGINGSAKEAIAFAILGYETLRGRPSNVPSATGARRATIQGKICWA